MNGVLKCENVDIIKVAKQEIKSKNGEVITYHVCIFMEGLNPNTLTVDKEVAPKIKPGSVGNLIIRATEDGAGQYKKTKLKIIDYQQIK